MRNSILLIGLIVLLTISSLWFFLLNQEAKKTLNDDPGFKIETAILLREYSEDKETANRKYLDKTIIVKGEINSCIAVPHGLNIELTAGNDLETITCSVDYAQLNNKQNFIKGRKIELKGRCGGYLYEENLGLRNIRLTQCSIIN